jgi:hypothetical protein
LIRFSSLSNGFQAMLRSFYQPYFKSSISVRPVKNILLHFLNLGLSGLFFWFIFHQFSYPIQHYLVIVCPLVMLPYLHRWWFPQLWNSPIPRAIMTHSTREHQRRSPLFFLDNFDGQRLSKRILLLTSGSKILPNYLLSNYISLINLVPKIVVYVSINEIVHCNYV